ncbi:DUF429 domain-containing protein [Streptomyces sp. NPDC056161]|uniref:DUF429 domain-containing protein n=1 Tax=Streptomyces sp. NPDC056161 TaxID=3345732 RepID=UPI0035E0729E
MDVVGVDACGRQGWVGIRLTDGGYAGSLVAARLADLLLRCPEATAVGVDIPLGLPESGWRAADRAAKAFLGARHSSVFMAPPRPVWEVPDHPAANSLCRDLTGNGLSRQAFALRAKVLDARECWTLDPERIHEVHPEVAFRAMAGTPLAHGKRSWGGQVLRRALLARQGMSLPDALGAADTVPADDVLDAAAAAWSAHRVATARSVRLPDPPERDAAGRPITITY